MVASESCIKGLGFDKGPCVTNLIVLNHSDWAFELTHGNGILPGLSTHFHIHRVVKYIELLVNSKASEQEQGETQMGGKSTRHHIVAAWRTSMSRKVPVLKFGVMCRGTTLFYFWWFRDQDYFVLQAAFNAFFWIFGF
jgi:hypothetical protein